MLSNMAIISLLRVEKASIKVNVLLIHQQATSKNIDKTLLSI